MAVASRTAKPMALNGRRYTSDRDDPPEGVRGYKTPISFFYCCTKKPGAPRDQSQHPRARNDYDEVAAYDSYMNPEAGFQFGPGDFVDAD